MCARASAGATGIGAIALIRAGLRRAPLTASFSTVRVAIGDLGIDVAARRLAFRGADVRLTPKEFDLWLHLMENAGVLIPRGRLLQVWGPDYGGEVVHLTLVNRLWNKIQADPGNPQHLPTEPWGVYRFQT
jgi:two-component system KDP operon response regulator KdpE